MGEVGVPGSAVAHVHPHPPARRWHRLALHKTLCLCCLCVCHGNPTRKAGQAECFPSSEMGKLRHGEGSCPTETGFSAVPPRRQDFGAVSHTVASMASWACCGSGVSDRQTNASSPAAAGDTSLVIWQQWCWITGAPTVTRLRFWANFHVSEPQCPCLKNPDK